MREIENERTGRSPQACRSPSRGDIRSSEGDAGKNSYESHGKRRDAMMTMVVLVVVVNQKKRTRQ